MNHTRTATLLRRADEAITRLRAEKQTLQGQVADAGPKIARLEELEEQEAKRAQVTRIVNTMIESGQATLETREDKIVELMACEQAELDTLEKAVEMVRDGDVAKVGELIGNAAGGDPRTAFYASFLGDLAD